MNKATISAFLIASLNVPALVYIQPSAVAQNTSNFPVISGKFLERQMYENLYQLLAIGDFKKANEQTVPLVAPAIIHPNYHFLCTIILVIIEK